MLGDPPVKTNLSSAAVRAVFDLGFSIGLLPYDDIAFRYHVIQSPRLGKRLIRFGLTDAVSR